MSTEILKSKSVLLELFYFDGCASERVSVGTLSRILAGGFDCGSYLASPSLSYCVS